MNVRSEGGLKLGCTVRVKVAPSDRVTAESELRLGLALFVEEAERVLGEAARVNVPWAIAYASVRLDVDDQVHLGSVRIDLREGVESLVEIAPDLALDGWVLRLRGGLVVDV